MSTAKAFSSPLASTRNNHLLQLVDMQLQVDFQLSPEEVQLKSVGELEYWLENYFQKNMHLLCLLTARGVNEAVVLFSLEKFRDTIWKVVVGALGIE